MSAIRVFSFIIIITIIMIKMMMLFDKKCDLKQLFVGGKSKTY